MTLLRPLCEWTGRAWGDIWEAKHRPFRTVRIWNTSTWNPVSTASVGPQPRVWGGTRLVSETRCRRRPRGRREEGKTSFDLLGTSASVFCRTYLGRPLEIYGSCIPFASQTRATYNLVQLWPTTWRKGSTGKCNQPAKTRGQLREQLEVDHPLFIKEFEGRD